MLASWVLILSLVLSALLAWADFRGLSMTTASKVLIRSLERYIILTLTGSKPSTGWKGILDSITVQSGGQTSWTRSAGSTTSLGRCTKITHESIREFGSQPAPKQTSGSHEESSVDNQAFWFALGVAIGERATKYVYGMIEATNEYKALDKLEKRASEEHGGTLREAKLHRVNIWTGEREDDACLLVSPEDGSEGLLYKGLPKAPQKSSQSCEEKSDPKEPSTFGSGWARKLSDPSPVVSLKHKE